MSEKPVLFVLAGVNGAGKSSILGRYLQERQRVPWFNPDAFARELMGRARISQIEANAQAWQEGLNRLDRAIAQGVSHAFETTLGGTTLTERIALAARTHDVFLWYCGLASAKQHLARVRARVSHGGHDIPEAAIHRRVTRAPANVIRLMPVLAGLRVYDNSREAGADGIIPTPELVLELSGGRLDYPDPEDLDQMENTPEWVRPLVAAALRDDRS